jgi:hypothetical protein
MKVVRFNIVRNGPGAVNVPPFRSSPLLLSLLDRAICLLALRGLPCFLRGARALPSSGFCGLAGCVLTLVCVAQLLPEEEDDMWHVYNLIGVGDHLEAVTVRWVQFGSIYHCSALANTPKLLQTLRFWYGNPYVSFLVDVSHFIIPLCFHFQSLLQPSSIHMMEIYGEFPQSAYCSAADFQESSKGGGRGI